MFSDDEDTQSPAKGNPSVCAPGPRHEQQALVAQAKPTDEQLFRWFMATGRAGEELTKEKGEYQVSC